MLFGKRSSVRRVSLVLGLMLVAGWAVSSATAGASKPQLRSARVPHAALTTVQFGYVPYGDDAPLFLGLKRGVFRKLGLNVKLVPAAAPTPIVANLVSGQEQFGFVTTNVLINAVGHGVPIKCVSTVDGDQSPDPAHDSSVLVAAPGSGITSPKGFQNKTVAVVQLNSLNSVDVEEAVSKAGGNPASVHLIALPFPQMAQALKSGEIAGAVLVSPFSATAISEGAKPLLHPNSSLFPNGTITCIATSTSYIKSHPQQVKAWAQAIDQSAAYAHTHQSQALATLVTYMKLSPAAAQHAVLSTNWKTTINAASVQKQEALLKRFGALSSLVPVSKLFYTP